MAALAHYCPMGRVGKMVLDRLAAVLVLSRVAIDRPCKDSRVEHRAMVQVVVLAMAN